MIHAQAKLANVVLDVGSYHTFAGQAGLQNPRFTSHSYLVQHTSHKKSQYKAGKQELNSENYNKQIHSVFENINEDGKVDKFHFNIQKFDKFVETILMDNLQLDGYSISLLIAQDIAVELDASQILKQRQKILDYLLEGMELTNIAFIKKPVLSTFALGRTSSVVLDSGHSFSHCSIVQDGYCVFNKTLRFGGSTLHNLARSQIQKKTGSPWKIKQQNSIESFRMSDIAFHKIVQLQKILNQFPYVSPKATMVSQDAEIAYQLPDGHKIKIRRSQIVDPFVNYPKFWQKYLKNYSLETPSFIDSSFFKVTASYRGLQNLVQNTIQQYFLTLDRKNHTICQSNQGHSINNYHDINRKRPNQLSYEDLINNVILAGGNVQFSNISAQITRGIKSRGGNVVQSPMQFNKDENGNQCSNTNSLSWVGGSIVSNLSAFNHFWIKLSEWKEYGTHTIAAKSLNQDILLKNHQLQESAKIGKKLQLISKKCA